jgi:hypothetical protein
VAQVLSQCGTTYAELTMIDEPPGKLRALEFDCRKGTARRVVIEIEYGPDLFSATRSWPEELVGSRIVTGVRAPATGGR